MFGAFDRLFDIIVTTFCFLMYSLTAMHVLRAVTMGGGPRFD
jgi:hypothetical protein